MDSENEVRCEMERDRRRTDALSLFAISLGVFLLIFGPGAGFYGIATSVPW